MSPSDKLPPPSSESKRANPSIWLALSGGGLRAAIFHYGCLKRMHELGLLGHVASVSATSGGSIIAALLQMHQADIARDESGKHGVFTYDWPAFESEFLELARRGLFAPVAQLIFAFLFYAVASLLILAPYLCNLLGFPIPTSWLPAKYIALVCLAVALILHLALAIQLFRENAHQPTLYAQLWARIDESYAAAQWSRPSVTRLLWMLLSPAHLRLQLMNLRAYKGQLLRAVRTIPATFLTATDLNSGKEMVFTSRSISDLGPLGSRELWEQRPESSDHSSDNIETAQAVCASSAFPPLFLAVPVSNRRGLLGVFADGGLLDNAALNVPKAFSVHIHEQRPRYSETRILPFREGISHIWVVDGGKSGMVSRRKGWGRFRAFTRIINVLVDQQSEAVRLDALNLARNASIDVRIMGLPVGFPQHSQLDDPDLARYAANIRTHLDGFSREEIAVLAYCGYAWAEYYTDTNRLMERYEWTTAAPFRSFEEILPERWRPKPQSIDDLRRHVRYSNRRLLLFRAIGRRLGL
jgi:predicted acylesterase/phospholipase RssA